MTIYLIQSKNMIINSDHIISAEFIPEHDEIDDEETINGIEVKKKHRPSCLNIAIAKQVLEQDLTWDGNVRGVAAISEIVKVRGKEADIFWDVLTSPAYPIREYLNKETTSPN